MHLLLLGTESQYLSVLVGCGCIMFAHERIAHSINSRQLYPCSVCKYMHAHYICVVQYTNMLFCFPYETLLQLVLTTIPGRLLSIFHQMWTGPAPTFPLLMMKYLRETNTFVLALLYHQRFHWLPDAKPISPLKMMTQVSYWIFAKCRLLPFHLWRRMWSEFLWPQLVPSLQTAVFLIFIPSFFVAMALQCHVCLSCVLCDAQLSWRLVLPYGCHALSFSAADVSCLVQQDSLTVNEAVGIVAVDITISREVEKPFICEIQSRSGSARGVCTQKCIVHWCMHQSLVFVHSQFFCIFI